MYGGNVGKFEFTIVSPDISMNADHDGSDCVSQKSKKVFRF